MDQASHNCPWCSASIPAGAAACPSCGAIVEGESASDIPGVTVVDTGARLGGDEGFVPDVVDPAAWFEAGREDRVTNEAAIAPPTPDVAREIERMKLEAEIDNAGKSVLRAGRGDTKDAREPSPEAKAAFEAGLLKNSGSAEEADLLERAKGLEIDKQV